MHSRMTLNEEIVLACKQSAMPRDFGVKQVMKTYSTPRLRYGQR